MRVVALVSGGKDSCYNMMQCVSEGHEIVALANLHPKDKDELDSYMYQTVGHMGIEKMATAMCLPLYRMETKGQSTQTGKHYVPTDDDEVEDLYNLLKWTKKDLQVEAVAVGAILSDYQRVRVENVCGRLNLVSLAYLWRRDQTELLQEMIDCQVFAIIIKVAALGLVPDRHLGKSLRDIQPHLLAMKDKYGLNVCGEGGEYETFTLNCPLFKQQIVVDDMQTITSSLDPVCPVGYINFTKLRLVPKDKPDDVQVHVKTSLDYLSDLNESSYDDLSDPDISETELEQIEERICNHHSRSNSLCLPSPVSVRRRHRTSTTIPTEKQIDFFPFIVERERQPIANQPNICRNSRGWIWVSGLQGVGQTAKDGMRMALQQLYEMCARISLKLTNICHVTLYVQSMADFAAINETYVSAFTEANPPTRVCVEAPLPVACQIVMEVVAHQGRDDSNRHTMHVQGISHWAPANIGPYSQSTRIGEITYVSGQIALVPGSMKIIDGGIRPQCKLALRHISRIGNANKGQRLRDVVQAVCFVTDPVYINEARRQWEKRTTNAIVNYIVVPALPRQALVEWQVWMHAHNDKFDYEETGCTVGHFTVFSLRRWNYESNCSAIVCHVSTGFRASNPNLNDTTATDDEARTRHAQLTQDITAEDIKHILRYACNKLLKGHQQQSSGGGANNDDATSSDECAADNESSCTPTTAKMSQLPTINSVPAIFLKCFYQVNSIKSLELLTKSIEEYRSETDGLAQIAATIIPVCQLSTVDNRFISISGVRHE